MERPEAPPATSTDIGTGSAIRSGKRLAVFFLFGALACHAACGPGQAAGRAVLAQSARPAGHREVQSNLLRSDYAGSQACRPCHADVAEDFELSPMHRMTRLPEQAEGQIRAPFGGDGAVFRFKGDTARLSQRGAERFMRVESRRFGDHLFRVTKVIGGHYREDFAGIEVASTEPGAAVLGDPHDERVLPVSYLLFSNSLRYKGYSVMVRERPALRAGGVWNRTCILCHNTSPYLLSILGALAGPGTPPYQGEVVDPLLPPDRRWSFEITDPRGLRRALLEEMSIYEKGRRTQAAAAGQTERELLGQAVRTVRARLNQSHLLEIGIGCESCHGGSREHAADFRVKPTFAPRASFLRVRTPPLPAAHARAQQINRVCARCHQVLFSRYPWTWEGGLRGLQDPAPGGSNINSGEARDFLLGACSSQMSCAACHDPHQRDDRQRRQELDTVAGNMVCLGCHPKLRGDEVLRAHAHHDPAGPGGLCMNCHMPRKVMTLDGHLGRYHRIGAPTDRVRVEGDRPLECALCHADRSVESLVKDMERLWGKTYDRAALRSLYGDLQGNVLLTTLSLGKPHEQAVAMNVLGRKRVREAAPLLMGQLLHPYPIVRAYAQQALGSVLGRPSPVAVDYLSGEAAEIRAAGRRWLLEAGVTPPRDEGPAAPPVPDQTGQSGED